MNNVKKLTENFIHWMSWVGENPTKNAFDRDKMEAINHEQFVLTYLDKVIVKGLDNHAQHFIDAYKQLGNWRHDIKSIEPLNHYTAMAHYIVKPDNKPDTPCTVIFGFIDNKCIGMHEVKVNLEGVLDIDENFIRVK